GSSRWQTTASGSHPSSPRRSGGYSRLSSAAIRWRAPASACRWSARSSRATAVEPGSSPTWAAARRSASPGLMPMRYPVDDRALNILLVDDDEIDVMTVRRAFAKANITNQLFVATDGVEALELLRSQGIPALRRLVLLDLNMPRMNGIEFLREIRS